MPRYTICPYFINENKMSISCEDVCRRYDTVDSKWHWMDMYCDTDDWMSCPYAADMTEAYYRKEKGDENALEKNKIEALEYEIKGLNVKLGKRDKKIERMQKKIDELTKQKQEFYRRWREAQMKLDKGNEDVLEELSKLGEIYEQRMCYLIDSFAPNQMIMEEDVKTWAGDRSFALVAEYAEDEELVWKVKFEEEESEDDAKHDISGVSEDDRVEA